MKPKDFFNIKARKEGYYARSIYKLEEINKKYNLIRKGDFILDIGCSPGSWSQLALKLTGTKGKVYGVDIIPIKPIESKNFIFIKEDINKLNIEKLPFFDVIISDVAPKTTGIKGLDQYKSLLLTKQVFNIVKKKLKLKGNFLCKIFQSKETNKLFLEIKKNFSLTKILKPKASKKRSKEIYIIAKNKL